jgi:hypothetical protein
MLPIVSPNDDDLDSEPCIKESDDEVMILKMDLREGSKKDNVDWSKIADRTCQKYGGDDEGCLFVSLFIL